MSREDRQKGQAAGVIARNARRNDLAERSAIVAEIVDWSERENLPKAALSATLAAIQRGSAALAGMELETPLDVLRSAEAARIWHSLMRLELGESTANTVTATVDPEKLAARLAKLRDHSTPEHQ